MLLLLEEDVKKKILILNVLDESVAQEFCSTSLEFLRSGINGKVYATAATKLGLEEESVRSAIEGIMFVMTQCAKLNLTDIDVKDSLLTIGLNEQVQNELSSWYSENKRVLRDVLTSMDARSSQCPHYVNLEWRIETQIASRALRDELIPKIILRFELSSSSSSSSSEAKSKSANEFVSLECDAANLLHLRDVLEDALAEARSQHLLKIARQIK